MEIQKILILPSFSAVTPCFVHVLEVIGSVVLNLLQIRGQHGLCGERYDYEKHLYGCGDCEICVNRITNRILSNEK